MLEINREKFFTIEDIISSSGYCKNTIYNFVAEKVISPPIKGLAAAEYPSQGLFRETVFDELQRYYQLKITGMKKQDIISQIKRERNALNESLL